jgi:hypothetical protein
LFAVFTIAPAFNIHDGRIFVGKIKFGSFSFIIDGACAITDIDSSGTFGNEPYTDESRPIVYLNMTKKFVRFRWELVENFDGRTFYIANYYVSMVRTRLCCTRHVCLTEVGSSLYTYQRFQNKRDRRKFTVCLFYFHERSGKFFSCERHASCEIFKRVLSLRSSGFDFTSERRMLLCGHDEVGVEYKYYLDKQIILPLQTATPQITTPELLVTNATQQKEDEVPLIHKRKNKFAWLYILFGFPLCLVGAAAICILSLSLFPVSKLFLGIGIALSSISILIGLRNGFIKCIDRVVINTQNKCVRSTMLALSSLNSHDLNLHETNHDLQLEY